MLNPKNKKYLSDMLLNIRIAACGGGRAKLILPLEVSRVSILMGILSRVLSEKQAGNTHHESCTREVGDKASPAPIALVMIYAKFDFIIL